MRVPLREAKESRAIYRARLWEMSTGDLMAGFGRGCLIVPVTLVVGMVLFLLDAILGLAGFSIGLELSVIFIGMGALLGGHYLYRRAEHNPFGSIENGVHHPPMRNPKRLFIADGLLYSGIGYFFISATFSVFELLRGLSRIFRVLF
jgi:hypothetical protein